MAEQFSLGERLRTLRTERRLSQRDLATKAGISTNAVSLIERNEISPSVSTLQSLARALNIKISYFFDEEYAGKVLLVRAADRPVITADGLRIEGVGKRLLDQDVEPFRITLDPHAHSGERQVVHSGKEFICCEQGKVEYIIDGQSYIVEEGDFLIFDASQPHLWRNPFEEPARFLLVMQASPENPESINRHFVNYPSIKHIGK